MITAMLNGVSGVNSFSLWLDVVSDNLANINTIGYKESRVTFRDIHNRTIFLGSAPGASKGGVNPEQYGFGTSVATIGRVFTSGDLMFSGQSTDLAIEGDGFFILIDSIGGIGDPNHTFYTRAGAFDIDANGNLVDTSTGYFVLGYMVDPNNISQGIDTSKLTPINLNKFKSTSPQSTTKVEISGNLSAEATVGDKAGVGFYYYDPQGVKKNLKIEFEKSADNTWTWISQDEDGNSVGTGTILFGSDGKPISGTTTTLTLPDGGSLDVDLSGISQFGGPSYVGVTEIDGQGMGNIVDVGIDRDGIIRIDYDNGSQQIVGQVALSNFTNPGGLMAVGDTMFREGPNSGRPIIGAPNSDSRGSILSGTLEMSNVNPANEMVNLILAQRGYQINSRVITTADSIVEEAINLPRR